MVNISSNISLSSLNIYENALKSEQFLLYSGDLLANSFPRSKAEINDDTVDIQASTSLRSELSPLLSRSIPLALPSTSVVVSSSKTVSVTQLYGGLDNDAVRERRLSEEHTVECIRSETSTLLERLCLTIHPFMSVSEQFACVETFESIQKTIPIDLVNDAMRNNKSIETSLDGSTIHISNTGAIRFKLKPIGLGSFKTTELMVRLKRSKEGKKTQPLMFEAISLELPIYTTRTSVLYDEHQIENELALHAHIRRIKKSNPERFAIDFSHVCSAKKSVVLHKGVQICKGMITEFCNGGNVNELVKNSHRLSLTDQYFIAAQMAKGVAQLHAEGIVHRDLKLDNFLIKLNAERNIERVQIADLGVASFIDPSKRYHAKAVPIAHQPPEYKIVEERFNPKGDVYQLGISLIELFLKKTDEEWSRIHQEMTAEKFQLYMGSLPNETVKAFILRMLNLDPTARPTMHEVVIFFENLRISAIRT